MVVAVVIITIEKNRHLVVNGLGLAFSGYSALSPPMGLILFINISHEPSTDLLYSINYHALSHKKYKNYRRFGPS